MKTKDIIGSVGYLPEALSHFGRSDKHYLAGTKNEEGFCVTRFGDKNLEIFQQDRRNKITSAVQIPHSELKDFAIWILRHIN